MEVNRGNKKLLEKLVEISKGRHVSDLIKLIHPSSSQWSL